jgi:hypothetical protein
MKYNFFQDGKSDLAKLIVVSLSLQPILSLAVRYNLSPDETAHKLAGMFTFVGCPECSVTVMFPRIFFSFLEKKSYTGSRMMDDGMTDVH